VADFDGTPGTYSYDGFHSFTFDIGEGWHGAIVNEGYFELDHGTADDETGWFTTNQFDGTIYTDACDGDGSTTDLGDRTPTTFFAHLSDIDELDVSDPELVNVASFDGLTATVTPNGCDVPILLWQTPTAGDFHLVNGEAAKIWAVDVGGDTVILTAEGITGQEDLDAMLPAVEAVIESMHITP
jgi:hypothetical protein